MPFNPISGIAGSTTVGGVTYAFGKWKLSFKSGLPKVNNFTSVYQQLVTGLLSATLTLDGPYDGGNMPLTAGATYVFVCKFSSAITLTLSAIVESIDPTQDIEDAARVSVTAQSSGSFTAAIT
jgi:hypothetical protein